METPPGALSVSLNVSINPSTFWANEVPSPGMSNECRSLKELEAKLSQLIDPKKVVCQPSREVDEVVAVRSVHDGRKWHRGKIQCLMQLVTGPSYRVVLLDYGTTLRVKPDMLRNMPDILHNALPPQAMTLVLENIVPLAMSISKHFNKMEPEIAHDWMAAAEKEVDDILKSYNEAYFVEGTYPRYGSSRYGDLLLKLKAGSPPESLSGILCHKKYAKYCPEEFKRRLEVRGIAFEDTPIECHSPFPSDNIVPRNISSPIGDSIPKNLDTPSEKKINTIEGFLKDKEKEAQSRLLPQPSESVVSQVLVGTNEDGESHKPSIAASRLSRLSALVRPKSNTGGVSSPEPPTEKPKQTSPEVPVVKALDSTEKPKQTSPEVQFVKALDSRFVPAGLLLKNEPKSVSNDASQRSRSNHNFSRKENVAAVTSPKNFSESRVRQEYGARPKENNSKGNKYSEPSNSSDSSCSEGMRGRFQKFTKLTPNNTSVSQSSLSGSGTESERTQGVLRAKLRNPESDQKDCSSSSADGIDKKIKSPNPANQAYSMRERFIRHEPGISLKCDSTTEEDYLARAVLLHGGFPPKPWMSYHDLKSKFSTHIEQLLLNRKWCYNIMTLEKFMWPAIQKRQNTIMVSPRKSGKTSSYLIPMIDLMIDLEQAPKGNGPLVLILCAGSKSVDQIHGECVNILGDLKKPPRVQYGYGLLLGDRFATTAVSLVNGCEIFITTPPFLLRMMKHHKYTYTLNFHRLLHYVLDQADILMTRFLDQMKEIQSMLVAEQSLRSKNKDEKDPIQVIVASEKWEPNLLSFSKNLRGNPLLCINDCYEACVYGKPDVFFYMTRTDSKPSKLIDVLRNVASLQKAVVFCDETEVSKIEQFLDNECLSFLVTRKADTIPQREGVLSSWNSSNAGQHYILLTTDSAFEDLKIQDATCVVHYSLPAQERYCFVQRLSSILDNLPNMFEKKPRNTMPAIHLLMDETNDKQLPDIVQLMQRVSSDLDQRLLIAADTASKKKEKETKIDKLFCKSLKMFGHCRNRSRCPNRHLYIPELDCSNNLPSSGIVTMQVLKIINACHFSVRLLDYTDDEGNTKQCASQYVSLAVMLSDYFSKPENLILVEEVNIGDIFALETVEDLFQRVQVVDVLDRDKYGKPKSVQVLFLDEGFEEKAKVYMLRHLSEEIKAVPSQSVDVFLCGLLPADQDDDYGHVVNQEVKDWLKIFADKEGNEKLFQGKIALSMKGSLWVDPLNIIEWLPFSKTFSVIRNIGQSLLERHFALPNPQHMPNLYKICGHTSPQTSDNNERNVELKPQPKPSWAFLESQIFEDVSFSFAESVSHIFLRRTKFEPLLDTLLKDIEKDFPNQGKRKVLSFKPKYVCLGKFENEDKDKPSWHRVQLLSQNDDGSMSVLFVDHGDVHNLQLENLRPIPDWAITRLPFQAIECSLAGVSHSNSVDVLYDLVDDGSKALQAMVCDRKGSATHTGGNHYLIALLDCSKQELSILNKDFLAISGTEPCEDQLKYLDFEIPNREQDNESDIETLDFERSCSEEIDLNLSDLEFKEDDLIDDEFGDFEVCMGDSWRTDIESIMESQDLPLKEISNVQENQHPNSCAPTPLQSSNPKNVLEYNGSGESGSENCNNANWEEERGDVIGRRTLPTLCSARPPKTKWLDDLYHVWIKFHISDVEKYFLQCEHNIIKFSTSVAGRHYLVVQRLRGTVCPDSLQSSIKGFVVEVKVKKACSGFQWDRLFHTRRRLTWVSYDLETTAIESDDSDYEFSLENVNKEIRKRPVEERRVRHQSNDKPARPDISSDSDDDDREDNMIDSDDLF